MADCEVIYGDVVMIPAETGYAWKAVYKKTPEITMDQTGSSEEEQKEIAGLFNAKIHEVETKQDKEKALKETIERIKENSIDVRSRQSDPNDLTVVMQLINEQKELEKLKKTHISID